MFKPTDKAENMYIIAEGKIKVYTISTPPEQMLYIYKKDDFIGGPNFLKMTEYIYYGQIIEDSVVVSLSKQCFDNIITEHPKVSLKILEQSFFANKTRRRSVTRLIENHADVKVASLLLSLARNFA